MSERPTPDELAEAIEEFLSGEILPTLTDQRLRFRMLVALNALGIVRRELSKLPPGDDAEQRELATRIRTGDVPHGTLARVKVEVQGRLRIASPRYLERYNELTWFDVRPEELDYWELAGNVGWAIGCLTQARRHLTGQDRSVELAVLGRLGAEVEYEICHLLEQRGVT